MSEELERIELERIAAQAAREQARLPERVEVPDVCCVRVCDLPAVSVVVRPAPPFVPGATLEVFATCRQHTTGGRS